MGVLGRNRGSTLWLGCMLLVGATLASCSGCEEDEAVGGGGAAAPTGGGGTGGGGGPYDPCADVTCDEPPPPVCVAEDQIRTYSGAGQCVDGSCVFPDYTDEPCTECCYGAEINLTGNPIGGGIGYDDILDPGTATAVVSSASELLGALAGATAGSVLYVSDEAEIDLSGEEQIAIPAGVTIASGRGRDGGAGGLIYCDSFAYPLFRTDGEGVRLTGLRLRGPNPEIGDHDYDLVVHSGAISNSFDGFEVDNCELWSWGTNAVSLGQGATDAYIHHNYIHHTRRAGLGYGVVLDRSFALIEGNLFDFCRHHIAATGRPGTSYEAAYNIVLEHANGHDFDMHGAADFDKRETMAILRFDEGEGDVAEDTSVSGYHPEHPCTLTNMDTASCWVAGAIATGLAFDGTDDHLECTSDSSLSTAAGSISFWIGPATLGSGASLVRLFDDASHALDVGLDAAGAVTLTITDGGAPIVALTSSATVSTASWHHVAVTQDGAAATLYVDGQPSSVSGSNGTQWTSHLGVGSTWIAGGPNGFFVGRLDEVRIYSRALEAEEVARHYGGNPDIAGDEIRIHHNTFRDVDQAAIVIRGVPYVGATIDHNWFHRIDPDNTIRQTNAQGNLTIGDNHWGSEAPLGTVLPIARLALTPAFGKAPLAVSADARTSFDPVGAISSTTWDFGDGRLGNGSTASHDYEDAGRYLVRTTVRDELGVVESAFAPLAVAPATAGYVLDFWVKDSYPGPLDGRYVKQAFVNEELVWSDDVADEEGWTHVSVDVGSAVAGQERADVALRVQSLAAVSSQEIIELNVFWDDVTLFGGRVEGSDFEAGGAWGYLDNGSSFSGRVSAMDPHAGNWAYLISYPYATDCPAGAWAEVRQSVVLLPPELVGSWTLDDGAGALARDGSLYGNHGTLVEMDPTEAWVAGVVSRALAFDGLDDGVDCGAATSLSSTEGTILAWVRNDGVGSEQTLYELADASGNNAFELGLDAEGRVRVTATRAGAPEADLTTTAALADGEFHHVAVTSDGTALAVYVDGALDATSGVNSGAWTDHVTVDTAWLGAGRSRHFHGVLDEVRAYSVALDASAIAESHRQGLVLADWRLDEGSGSVTLDESVFGHDCTLTNMDPAASWTSGKIGGALSFDGVDDVLECAEAETLSSREGTIELWLAPGTLDDERDLVNIFEDGWENFLLLRRSTDGRVLLLIEDDDSPVVSVVTGPVIADDGWHHVAVTQGGSGVLVYVDGAPVTAGGTNSPAWTDHLALTGAWLGAGHWSAYEGSLDEIRIWARALRPDEIALHAAAP